MITQQNKNFKFNLKTYDFPTHEILTIIIVVYQKLPLYNTA